MLRTILIGLAVLVVLLVLVVATRPPTFHVERSMAIAAPPERVFPHVNDFHAWTAWSPWEKIDPQMQRTYSGTPAGVGTIYAWDGNGNVGAGRMTITKSTPSSQIVIRLEFFEPFAATNTATFTFVPTPTGTTLTWAMDGSKNFLAKALHMVMDMDKMVGGSFEQGLAALAAIAERAPAANAAGGD